MGSPRKLTVEYLTCGQVAKVAGTTTHTAQRWIDSGALAGYRLPGNQQDRRVHRDDLLAFFLKHGHYRAAEALTVGSAARVLVLGTDADFFTRLTETKTVEWHRANLTVEAGFLFRELLPRVVMIDFAIGLADARAAAAWLVRRDDPPTVLGLLGENENEQAYRRGLLSSGFTEVVQKPADPSAVAVRAAEACKRRCTDGEDHNDEQPDHNDE